MYDASQGVDLPDLPPEVLPGLAQVPRQGAKNTTYCCRDYDHACRELYDTRVHPPAFPRQHGGVEFCTHRERGVRPMTNTRLAQPSAPILRDWRKLPHMLCLLYRFSVAIIGWIVATTCGLRHDGRTLSWACRVCVCCVLQLGGLSSIAQGGPSFRPAGLFGIAPGALQTVFFVKHAGCMTSSPRGALCNCCLC